MSKILTKKTSNTMEYWLLLSCKGYQWNLRIPTSQNER